MNYQIENSTINDLEVILQHYAHARAYQNLKGAVPSLYIHRIAIHPLFRGKNLVGEVIQWSKKHAFSHQKEYIRLDTVGYNKPLIDHYTKNGFSYLGGIHLKAKLDLPAHYHDAEVSLFEMNLKPDTN